MATVPRKIMARSYFPTGRVSAFIAAMLIAPTTVEGAAFPAQLLGKSIIVSWTSNRQQKFQGSDEIAARSWSEGLSIYISSAGRAFSKEQATGGGRRRGRSARTSESDQAPDVSRNEWGGNRVVHFEEGALAVDSLLISGARRVIVTFDDGYDSCNARVIYGREGGITPIRQRSVFSGRQFQVVSIQTSTSSCSIMSGNVFGGQ
jgi:hypothetical protein